jgi:hypothetical protein
VEVSVKLVDVVPLGLPIELADSAPVELAVNVSRNNLD